jgi:hypothetical protein
MTISTGNQLRIQINLKIEIENMKRGKASSARIGIEQMGQCFNTLLTVQIPLKQKERRHRMDGAPKMGRVDMDDGMDGMDGMDDDFEVIKGPSALKSKSFEGPIFSFEETIKGSQMQTFATSSSPLQATSFFSGRSGRSGRHGGTGVSSAARVSKGSVADEPASKVDVTTLKRSETEHITITVIMYHVVKGGLPTKEDVIAAVAQLDQLYSSCKWSGTLRDISTHNVIPTPQLNKPVAENYKLLNRAEFPV